MYISRIDFFHIVQQEHKWKMFLEIDGDETALLLVKVLFTDFVCLKLVSGKVMLILVLVCRA